jgi:hypothetical protein
MFFRLQKNIFGRTGDKVGYLVNFIVKVATLTEIQTSYLLLEFEVMFVQLQKNISESTGDRIPANYKVRKTR